MLKDPGISGNIFRSVVVLAVCTALGLAFFFLGLSEANIITIYILGILLISAITSSWLYGNFSSVIGVLLFNCLFTEPRFTLLVYDPQYTITIVVMLLASLFTSYIMNLLRGELQKEMLVTRRSEILLETSKRLQDADTPARFHEVAISQLANLLGRPVLLFPVEEGVLGAVIGKEAEHSLCLDVEALAGEVGLAAWVCSPASRDTLVANQKDGGRILFYKMRTRDTIYAVVCTFLKPEQQLSSFEENLIFAMLDEIALAIERTRLHEANQQIVRIADEERLRATLLRAISHDLRTPLTGILGDADILLQNGREMEPEIRERLYRDIRDESRWLIDLVENLLFVTRLESGAMPVRLEPELLQDVLGEALRLATKRETKHEIRTELPEALFMVEADARLLVQVVLNLLDNALKFAPGGTEVVLRAFASEGRAVVEVADEGPGIPLRDKEKIFEMFYTAENQTGDGRRGLGLGLALCKAIITAHGGEIFARDNTPAGTVVGFTLKMEEVPA